MQKELACGASEAIPSGCFVRRNQPGIGTDLFHQGHRASAACQSAAPGRDPDCQQLQRLFYACHRAGGAGNHWASDRRISGIAAAIHGLNRSLEQFDTDQTRLPLKGGDGN